MSIFCLLAFLGFLAFVRIRPLKNTRYYNREESPMTQGGGLLQLVAQGKQDVFLTGNPQVSWFKMVYRRYTNFAMESQQMYFDGTPNFGQKITCLVQRAGDLLGPMFLRVVLPQLYVSNITNPTNVRKVGYVNSPGHSLIQEISIQIGEQEIDKQRGEWMEIYSALTTDASHKAGFEQMIQQRPGYPFLSYQNNAPDVSGNNPTLPNYVFSRQNGNPLVDVSGVPVIGGEISPGQTGPYPQNYDDPIMGPQTLYIPLRFWFNKNPGLYLPLLAMQYHPVRINITLSPIQSMYYTKELYLQEINPALCGELAVLPAQLDIQMWGDYMFLDVPERRRFVSAPLEYLIDQVQYTPPLAIPANSRNATLRMDFNHPIKEFVWVLQRNVMVSRNENFNWSSLGCYEIQMLGATKTIPNRTDLMLSAVIQLDGQDRFDTRDAAYFRLVQPYQRHTTVPSDRYIYVYSIALRPEDAQPSGSLNASRIDTLVLQLNLSSSSTNYNTSSLFGDMTAHIYATNYNILRVIDGYAGLLFAV